MAIMYPSQGWDESSILSTRTRIGYFDNSNFARSSWRRASLIRSQINSILASQNPPFWRLFFVEVRGGAVATNITFGAVETSATAAFDAVVARVVGDEQDDEQGADRDDGEGDYDN